MRGAIVGATLGAPFRGRTAFRKLHFYEPIPARMAPSPALDAWLVSARHLKAGGSAAGYGKELAQQWKVYTHESAFGHLAHELGLDPPLAGSFQNPLGYGAEAVGRVVFWGLAFPGDLDRALEYAYFDASFDHDPDGTSCALAIAALACLAPVAEGVTGLLRFVSDVVPSASRAREALAIAVRHASPLPAPEACFADLPAALDTADPYDAALALAQVAAALLLARGEFGLAVRLAAGAGGASDHAALATGAIAAALGAPISDEWLGPLGEPYVAGAGLREVEIPASLSEFVRWIASAFAPLPAPPASAPGPVQAHGDDASATEPNPKEPPGERAPEQADPAPEAQPGGPPTSRVASDGLAERESSPPAEGPAEGLAAAPRSDGGPRSDRPTLSEAVAQLIAGPQDAAVTSFRGLRLSVRYLDGPVAIPDRPRRFLFGLSSEDGREHVVEPCLEAPPDWQVASRLASCRIRPGEAALFPVVVKPGPTLEAQLALKLDSTTVLVPLVPAQRWYVCGPFPNPDGSGFDRVFRCEDALSTSAVFNGRSDLPVRWEPTWQGGITLDVEPFFKTGPGVIYLWARCELPSRDSVRLVAATGVGAVVKVNGQTVVRYHDVHRPVPRPIRPYVADLPAGGPLTLLVKVLRNREPLPPLALYFLDSEGRILVPRDFQTMPE